MPEYYEDVGVGDTHATGEYEVTREGIHSFASQYDPQPIHTDEEAAAESMFDGLVASGWHTASATMRLLVDHRLPDTRALGAVGVDELRFPAPVRPGDVLSAETEVLEKEVWDEDRGLVHVGVTTTNHDEEVVLTMVGLLLWERHSQ